MRALLSALLLFLPVHAEDRYQRPPKPIQDVFDAPLTPSLVTNPNGKSALLVEAARYPSIRDLARPMLRLAGERIDPANHGRHNPSSIKSLGIQSLASGKTKAIPLPAGRKFGAPRWSPDGTRFVMLAHGKTSVELWVGDGQTGTLKQIPGLAVNTAFGNAEDWMGSNTLLVTAVPSKQGPAPKEPEAPVGPNVQEHNPSKGRAEGVATLQDLLKNAHDEALYEYFATSQLVQVDLRSGNLKLLGKPAIFGAVTPSPDGLHVLAGLSHRPFSYQVDDGRFPIRYEVWNLQGHRLRTVADLPLAENIPAGGVRKGPRQLQWIPGQPHRLVWIEALDEGNPKKKVEHRDQLLSLDPIGSAESTTPQTLTRVQHRLMGVEWTQGGTLALLREYDRDKKWTRTWFLESEKVGSPRLVFDLSYQDRYKDPGTFLTELDETGHRVLRQRANQLWLSGAGATPKGDRPFLDRFEVTSLKTERLFQSAEGTYESLASLLPDGSFLTRVESSTLPPNYVHHPSGKGEAVQLTHFTDPAPALRKIQKQLVRYKRPDGVELSFTLYLPPDYQKGERRPAVVWAYPQEFTNAGDAGQVSGSTDRFTTMGGASHLFLLMAGYVVLDAATMPIVGTPETVNNTFLEQVVASAKAAIDKADELGVIDPQRVAVGGHSYGAFMTANLLAHSKLFKAGIARSGAYNRTLTPFGFQSEQRSLWEAPEMYLKVSPFMAAHHFQAPILLIHGEADNNQGTFPLQSERLYAALKGNNQPVRYVTLPHEAHGYAARESLEHCLWEMVDWCNRHLK